jgi:anhydro-N-acetylmuramic acid kinase
MQVYKVLGVMSGTSLDGLDLAYCELFKDENWQYKIGATATIPYSEKREKILRTSHQLSGMELVALDHKFGKYIGEECHKFILKHQLNPDFISSHGHTIFHQPQRGFTKQIGHGANIYTETGIPVVCDFRTQDVAMGGQGAPLVPIGDQLLFNEFQACLNLGGFANISTHINNDTVAWDICAVNVVLNEYAQELGEKYDDRGAIAQSGKLHIDLLADLDQLSFYDLAPPKSLGIEWVNNHLKHLLEKYPIPIQDILHTYVLHIAKIIGMEVEKLSAKRVLVTGGGAYHNFFLDHIRLNTTATIEIPDDKTIQYKEALIFALLGTLRWRGEVNVLKSVTGAKMDHCSGMIYGHQILNS